MASAFAVAGSHNTMSLVTVFLAAATIIAVAVLVVMAKSLPLKGPSIPLLGGYIGCVFSSPFLITEYLKRGGSLSNPPQLPALSLRSCLVFSVVFTAIEYLNSRIFPYGSYGLMGYTQYSDSSLLQLVSLGGIWTLSFYISFVSTTLATAFSLAPTTKGTPGPPSPPHSPTTPRRTPHAELRIQGEVDVRSRLRLVWVVIMVVLGAHTYGGLRQRYLSAEGATNAPMSGERLRVAGVWPPNTITVREQLLRHHLGLLMDGKPGPGTKPSDFTKEAWQEIITLTLEDYQVALELIATEAKSGAHVVMLPELSLVSFEGAGVDDPRVSSKALFERVAKCARDNNVFIGFGVGLNDPFMKVPHLSSFTSTVLELPDGMTGIESNRFFLFSPTPLATENSSGDSLHEQILINYGKRNPVPIIESPFGVEGDAVIPVANVPYFKDTQTTVKVATGAAICFDMEHPWHISQLGLKADLILNPSYDWPGLNPYHARITAFRAVETGTNIFHHCLAGTSLAVDFLGNVLATADYYGQGGQRQETSDSGGGCVPHHPEIPCRAPHIVASMPTRGTLTLYSCIGDLLAFVCLLVSVAMILRAIVPQTKDKTA